MKYQCRDCPKTIRDRCIQESGESPSVKTMMRRAFEAGTDTQWMWDRLQMSCLRARQDQQKPASPRRSLLSQRLQEAQKRAETVEISPPPLPPSSLPTPGELPDLQPPTATRMPARYGLILRGGQHRVALPPEGELVLGRFDLATRISPDVDLTYDDRGNYAISRRHARITGRSGQYEIEDMGSTNGTYVNGRRLGIGQKMPLRLGDRISLGNCEFTYAILPDLMITPGGSLTQAYLWVAFTGQRFLLPSYGEVVVGRGDPVVGLFPDIDLGTIREVARVVARRHVKIIAREGRHYVQDLGSADGTRLNGVRISIDNLQILGPGDHLWLGGCVLAYDVEEALEPKPAWTTGH